MITTKQNRETRQIELVETHNLALSLRRIKDSPGYDNEKWKRCLYHALGMAYTDRAELEKIRVAMNLP